MDEYIDNTGSVEQYSFDDSSSQDENVGEEAVQQSDDSVQNTESDSGEQTEQSADDVKEFDSGEQTEQFTDDVKEDDSNIIEILSEIVKDKIKNDESVSLDPDVSSSESDTSNIVNDNVKELDSVEDSENDKREIDKNVNKNDSESSVRSVETTQNDYSSVLGDILHALDTVSGNQETMIEAASQNSMNSGLESQSATNVLLIVIIVILLFDIVVHFIGRLF